MNEEQLAQFLELRSIQIAETEATEQLAALGAAILSFSELLQSVGTPAFDVEVVFSIFEDIKSAA